MIFENWIKYFGSPLRFHSDNGGEFANKTCTDMSEKLGVEITTSPAKAPFSNGIVERAHVFLYEAMMKTVEDTGCSKEMSVVSIRNKCFTESEWICSESISLRKECKPTFSFFR